MENLENRLRNENTSLIEFYTKKLATLTEEKAAQIEAYEEKLTKIEENYGTILAKLKSHHIEEVDSVREDHRKMIDNLR